MKNHVLKFHCIRNVSSPEDSRANRKHWCGVSAANEFFQLPDDDNVREFLEEAVKIRGTRVNDAMRETLDNERELFGILNGGIAITCTGATIDDKARQVELRNPSIINGSQTRGVLKKYFEDAGQEGDTDYPTISFELIECNDDPLHAKISIARNFQNQVAPVSTYGRKGLFNDLEAAMQKHEPKMKLRKSETDVGSDIVDTEKLLQVITVTVPKGVKMPRLAINGSHARPYAFSQKAVCLKDFDAVMGTRLDNGSIKTEYPEARQYFLDVAYDVWTYYKDLNTCDEFKVFRQREKNETKYKSPVKKSKGKIIEVAQGIKFPVMSALALFVEKTKSGTWCFAVPRRFELSDVIDAARMTYTHGAGAADPARMGKSVECYISLYAPVTAFKKYSEKK
jgi:AIPR protein